MTKNKIVIFDLDGTLALIDARRKLAAKPNGKINWGIFFNPKNIALDKPNWPVIESFKALQAVGYKMVIFSGRDGISKKETTDWLTKYGIKPDLMKMRPKGDYTPDNDLKQGWLDDLQLKGLTKDDILCVFDDRDQVVKMWRKNGLACFQVNYGDF